MTPRKGGRPRAYGAKACVKLSVRLTPQQRADLEAVATENSLTLTNLLREAVNSFVADYRDGVQLFPRPSTVSSPRT